MIDPVRVLPGNDRSMEKLQTKTPLNALQPSVPAEPASAQLWAPEKLLEISLQKLDSTKKDLEKNWTSQLASVGASLGVILGLGSLISKRMFEAPGYENILYLILPLINFYLFMRFGGLLSAFSSARFAAEKMVKSYYQKAELEKLDLHQIPEPSIFFETNSYFEYYHNLATNWGTFAYLLLVPIILALNNVTSIYMLFKFFDQKVWAYVVITVYVLPIALLYINYYAANKKRPFAYTNEKFNFILFAYAVIFGLGVLLLSWALFHGVSFSLKPSVTG